MSDHRSKEVCPHSQILDLSRDPLKMGACPFLRAAVEKARESRVIGEKKVAISPKELELESCT